jgi:DNA-binding Xre family transcriptional regulator
MAISKLRLRILESGETQYMLAAKCGMSPSRMSEYVVGKKAIAAHHIPRMCKVLKCQPQDLMGVDDEADIAV